MAKRGLPSDAHEYNSRDECIHCGMYKTNVEKMAHVCKAWREELIDRLNMVKEGIEDLREYRRNGQ